MAKDFYPIGTFIVHKTHTSRPGAYIVIPASESKAEWDDFEKYNWIKGVDGECYWTNEDADHFMVISHPLELLIYGV